jgi:tetratricopeptide (TPR) repeat protein
MVLEAGTRLGRYEVLGLIGAGGMGEVYRARDTRLGRTVALKVLPPRLAADRVRRERFEREARAASALDHPHICVLHDVGSEGDVHFLVLEHLEGQTLAERLAAGRLPQPEAVRLGAQIADALDAAHKKGIVHRDLKPGNIMVTKSGVKLLDFGLARLTEESRGEDESTLDQLSGVGRVAGTLPYMSPEQLSWATVDARSDIWALGVVLYEMLAGRRPFEGGTTATLMTAILQGEPPALSSVEPPLPPALEHVVGRCLAKDPEARWQTARDVASELGWISEGRTTGSVAAPSPAPARGLWRAWALVAIGVLVAAGAGLAWWRAARVPLDPKGVAVTAFENRTGDGSLDSLGRTIADQISNGLTRIEGVRVAPGVSGAGIVVSGIYTVAGEDVSIQARVTDVRSGRFQALDPANGPRAAPTTAVEGAQQRVLGAVAVKVDPDWAGDPAGSPPTYDAYRELRVANEDASAPVSHLRRAVQIDPDFVTARMQLIAWMFVSRDYPEAAKHVAFLEGRKARLTSRERLFVEAYRAWLSGRTGDAYLAAREVRKLQPTDPTVAWVFSWFAQNAYRFHEAVEALMAPLDWERYYARSRISAIGYFFNLTQMLHELGEHERELREARRGERLHPEVSGLQDREAIALAALGRLDEMERVVGERLSLASARQRSSLFLSLGLELRVHGHRQASAAMLERALQALESCPVEDARTPDARADLALLRRLAGRLDEADAIYEELARGTPSDSEMALVWAGQRGVVAALRGRPREALRISDELGRVERPYLFGVHTYERARIAAELGARDQAVDLLHAAIAQGFILSYESNGLHVEPSFESLRGYPPFDELVRPR